MKIERPLQKVVRAISTPRGAKLSIAIWLLIVLLLSVAAPGAKEFAVNAGEGAARGETPSAEAQRLLDERFPLEEGMPALLVFHDGQGIGAKDDAKIAALSRWLSSEAKPSLIMSTAPYDRMPNETRKRLLSEDGTTLLLNFALKDGLESGEIGDTLDAVKNYWQQEIGGGDGSLSIEMTGPAAIAADTIKLFRNADVILMLATVGLILVLLIVIYRSPLLAVIPLAIAGIVYTAVDRIIGWAGKIGLFAIDKQSLSIMMILLFAVLTDYCLFVFSRYREQLRVTESKYAAMGQAMTHVAEPILFSGGTVLLAMLALFAAVFKPYHGFAPVFAIAVGVMLIAGITLIPAVFAVLGRKGFWPFALKIDAERTAVRRQMLWDKVAALVVGKPKRVIAVSALLLVLASLNIGSIRYSFNLMNSFPENMASRQGYETLESHYPPGQLAPATMILKSEAPLEGDSETIGKLSALTDALKRDSGVSKVVPDLSGTTVLPDNLLSDDRRSVKLQLILNANPYDPAALDTIERWRADEDALLTAGGFDAASASLHFAGKTAEQLDVRTMNERDTVVVFTLIGVLLLVMLALQTRSVALSLLMIVTILLSYSATIGLSWFVFHEWLGFATISYRIPMYVFVFMVALGIDYNIMLVSRIREEAANREWKDAVRLGVSRTGGVISSAGLILAATFGVLMTQPLQELYLFGFAMAAGILVDTFLVRGMLLPALLAVKGRGRPASR